MFFLMFFLAFWEKYKEKTYGLKILIREGFFMEKKKRSAGSIIAGFFRGLAMLLLCLILIISVTVNIKFYADDSVVNINWFGKDYCLFLNNNKDLSNITDGALIFADKKMAVSTNTYVLCEVTTKKNGKPMKHKTVLALASEVQNENGSVSYEVMSNNNPDDSYTINKNKIIATVIRPYELPGKCISFIRSVAGIISTVAVPAFLLIVLCGMAIAANKERYEDDLSEARILADELRRTKNKDKPKKKKEPVAAEEPKPAETLPDDYNEFNDGVNPTFETYNFEEEANKKAMELKRALEEKQSTTVEPESQPESKPVQNEPVFQEYRSEDFARVDKSSIEERQFISEPEKQTEPAYSAPSPVTESSVPKNRFTASLTSNALINELAEEISSNDSMRSESAYADTYSPAPEMQPKQPVNETKPAPAAPVQKAAAPAPQKKIIRKKVIKQRPVQKLNANSIDDLIRIIDSEKDKL